MKRLARTVGEIERMDRVFGEDRRRGGLGEAE